MTKDDTELMALAQLGSELSEFYEPQVELVNMIRALIAMHEHDDPWVLLPMLEDMLARAKHAGSQVDKAVEQARRLYMRHHPDVWH